MDKSLPQLPKVNKNPNTFTVRGQKWLLDYFITTDVAKNYHIWETERNSLIFPVFHHDKIVFYVERYYDKKRIFNRGKKKEMLIQADNKTVVIVEDFLSAIRIHNAGYNVICLFGTKIKYKNLKKLVLPFNDIILWLDGDEAGQTSCGVLYSILQKIISVRRLVGCPKKIHKIRTDLDPKKYRKCEIEKYIKNVLVRD